MGCRSDYMEPRAAETESKLVAELVVHVYTHLKLRVPEWIDTASKHIYGAESELNTLTILLCSLCKKLDDDQQSKIIYNARNKTARKLASWWEAHQEADRRHEAEDAEEKRKAKLKKSALAKLDDDEIEALDLD